MARAHQVDLGLFAGLCAAAELQDRRHVDGLHDLLKAHLRRALHAWVGGADGGVESLGGLLVGCIRLLHLDGGWRRWKLFAGGRLDFSGGRRRRRCGSGYRGGGLELERSLVGGRSGGLARRGCWVGVGVGGAVEGELAAVGNDEGLILFGHDCSLSLVRVPL